MKTERVCAVASKQALPLGNPFRRIAGIYDAMSLLVSFGLIRVWRKRVAQRLAVGTGEVALDLGTGTADFAIELTRVSAVQARIIGIDLTPEMLAQARRKVCLRGLGARIELRVGNGEQLDLPDNSVDLCCSSFLVRTLTDLEQGLREMRRVVRPGGRLVCLEVSHPPGPILRALFHGYFYTCAPLFGALLGQKLSAYQYFPQSLRAFPDAPRLKALMEECGWKDVHFHYLTGGFVALHCATKK